MKAVAGAAIYGAAPSAREESRCMHMRRRPPGDLAIQEASFIRAPSLMPTRGTRGSTSPAHQDAPGLDLMHVRATPPSTKQGSHCRWRQDHRQPTRLAPMPPTPRVEGRHLMHARTYIRTVYIEQLCAHELHQHASDQSVPQSSRGAPVSS